MKIDTRYMAFLSIHKIQSIQTTSVVSDPAHLTFVEKHLKRGVQVGSGQGTFLITDKGKTSCSRRARVQGNTE